MSGIIRNLLTLISALAMRHRAGPWATVHKRFWVTPFDCGTRVSKSDKYLQLAESAQLDFLVRTGLLGTLLREGHKFVNTSQLVVFLKPVAMFKRVRIETAILFADDRCAYFSHVLFLEGQRHGQILVKMKFKKGGRTVPPESVFGECARQKPACAEAWDRTLEHLS